MKKFFLLGLLFAFSTAIFAQLSPVDWTFKTEKKGEKEYLIHFIADIKDGWIIYSQFNSYDEGPIPTSFQFNETHTVEWVDEVTENGHLKEEYDEIFDMVLKKLDGRVVFTQHLFTDGKPTVIEGFLTFMTCDNERCLPPRDVDFSFVLD